jgi:ABC-type sugar transport system ATPase subunit
MVIVSQNYAPDPHMNVYKNVAFGLKQRQLAREPIDSASKTPEGRTDPDLSRIPAHAHWR